MDVTADLDTVTVTHDGVLIATHVRAWARHLVVTDPAHVARAAEMRRDFRTQRVRRPDPEEAVQIRDLAANQLKEQVRGVLVKRDTADFIDHQETVAAQFHQFLGVFPAGMRLLEPGDLAGGGVEEDPVPGIGRLDADPDREMCFPGTNNKWPCFQMALNGPVLGWR